MAFDGMDLTLEDLKSPTANASPGSVYHTTRMEEFTRHQTQNRPTACAAQITVEAGDEGPPKAVCKVRIQ